MIWERDAACRSVDQEIFFPKSEEDGKARALTYCSDCRVRKECLMYSIAKGETVKPGIWGGMTTVERRRVRRSLSVV